MNDSVKRNSTDKFEEILLLVITMAGLLFMLIYWR